jgi:hypothetical protein
MSVKSYLDELTSQLNIAARESASIDKSIVTLAARASGYFGTNLKEKFQFGSSVRNTMLPRKADYKSDVDYMLVLDNQAALKPQTLLNRVKAFAEFYYSASEIRQSTPTVVLELNHIKFDLVPSYRGVFGSLYIPAPASSYQDWLTTEPLSFNARLDDAHRNSGYELRPALRLLKYWNALNGYIYRSFPLEERMVNAGIGWNETIKTCFYAMIANLYSTRYELSETNRLKVERAMKLVDNVRAYESNSQPISAEIEIAKLLPSL